MSIINPVNVDIISKAELAQPEALFRSAEKIILMADQDLVKHLGLEDLVDAMLSRGVYWISAIPVYPTQADVSNTILKLKGMEIERIIAIGGGSAIDFAKAVSVFHYMFNGDASPEKIEQAIRSKEYQASHRTAEILAIPTTAGTGSEMTPWATIWDVNKQSKMSIDHESLFVRDALVVPELMAGMPVPLTVSTGLDALCHACEAFWARSATYGVQEIACRSVEIIMTYLPRVLEELDNLEYREGMARGSVMAGLAFSQTHTTACHSISYPLTMYYQIPHGIACAMSLPEIAEINRPGTPRSKLLFEIFEKHGGLPRWMEALPGGRPRLHSFGVPKDALQMLAEKTFTKGRMDNNPVELSQETVYAILKKVY